MKLRALTLFCLAIATPAAADNELTIARSSAPVADQVNTLTPARNLPGSTIDYMLTVTNPVTNALLSIRTLTLVDPIATSVKFSVTNLGGNGPVEFVDGNLLTIPLGASGLGYTFKGLGATDDSVEFTTNGTNWTYTPVDQGDGYDSKVRGIRVTLSGTRFATAGSFRLRYRVKLK